MQIKRGDIYYIRQSGYGTGSEMDAGRPGIIISNDVGNKNAPIVTVVYLTTQDKKPLPTHVAIHCKQMSTALCEQISTVSKERIGDYVRSITDDEMEALNKAILCAIGIGVVPAESQNEDYEQAIQERDEHITMLQKQLSDKTVDISNGSDAKVSVERDLYKRLYEQLLDKMTER